ncbi:MAG: DUF305 domain-containing protein [Candidatus Eremiobacteraeota bacterium]|nr:DUF305 domain-containing protein [Candidatus Eremiobacteraeota bacterium]
MKRYHVAGLLCAAALFGAASDRLCAQGGLALAAPNATVQMDMAAGSKTPEARELDAAMRRMMQSMSSAKPSGDADRDFMTTMIAHHQAAVDMARTELRYGKNRKVMGLARGIIAAQQREINLMRSWLRS